MDGRSVTRPSPSFTKLIVAGAHLCDQVAGLLQIELKTARRAFLGEPVEEVLAMAGWALKHQGEAGFDPERVLPAWAEKRGRGYWRSEDRRVEGCALCHGSGWTPGPYDPSEGTWEEGREGVECPSCRGSKIALKPLEIVSNGEKG